jgi:hypothetical protein
VDDRSGLYDRDVRSVIAVVLVACGGSPSPTAVENHTYSERTVTLRDHAKALVARWNQEGPLSTHPVTLVIHCPDGDPERTMTLEPDLVNATIVQEFGPVKSCDEQCCDVVPDPRRPDVVVRKLCFDAQHQLDQIHTDGVCRGD